MAVREKKRKLKLITSQCKLSKTTNMHLQEVGWGRGEQVSQYFSVCACSCPVGISRWDY